MLRVVNYPERSEWPALIKRPALQTDTLVPTVRAIMEGVRDRGDEAVREYSLKFDGVAADLTPVDTTGSEKEIGAGLTKAMQLAAENIRRFHATQLRTEPVIETVPGVRCWRRPVAIDRVGLYIPGGSAPLFSTVLMLGIPARLAGCKEIILCTPPRKDGSIHPAVLYAAFLAGIERVFPVGGVQAIAAMTFGTPSIPPVHKIFGPGNQYVTCAKQLAQQEGVAIDMPAGPSEVCVLADDSADPAFVAADLLSQAEHGADSQVLLVTDSAALATEVIHALPAQLADLPRRETASHALQNSHIVVLRDLATAMDLVNEYAPEHLIIACKGADQLAEQVRSAGSVFIGNYSPESAGDYASGTNHTLPTNGFARAFSGVSVDSFVKKITFQELSREGLEAIAPAIVAMAAAEGLDAHAAAVKLRLNKS